MVDLLKQYEGLIRFETDIVALMANTSAFIFESLENLNWAGFYLMKENELVLGPFQGKTACYRIALHRGVCGHAATTKQSIIVDDVHAFPEHIACDSASNSELVVPILKDDEVVGVIDLDSFKYNNFKEEDLVFIEEIAKRIAEKF